MLAYKRRLADQAGFVLPTAIIVTMIVTVLAGAAIKISTQTSKSTTRDVSTKAALEAAEGGLQVASYRINQLKPEACQLHHGERRSGSAERQRLLRGLLDGKPRQQRELPVLDLQGAQHG